MKASITGGLRIAGDADLVEERLEFVSRSADIGKDHAGGGVKVDTQFIGVLCIGGKVRPRMKPEATHVHRPRNVRKIRRHHRVRRGSVGRRHDCLLQPLGRMIGNALLIKRLSRSTIGKPLQQHRPPAHRAHQRLGHGEVVVDEVEFGLAAFREEHLVRTGDTHVMTVDHQRGGVVRLRHGLSVGRRAPTDVRRRSVPAHETLRRYQHLALRRRMLQCLERRGERVEADALGHHRQRVEPAACCIMSIVYR